MRTNRFILFCGDDIQMKSQHARKASNWNEFKERKQDGSGDQELSCMRSHRVNPTFSGAFLLQLFRSDLLPIMERKKIGQFSNSIHRSNYFSPKCLFVSWVVGIPFVFHGYVPRLKSILVQATYVYFWHIQVIITNDLMVMVKFLLRWLNRFGQR